MLQNNNNKPSVLILNISPDISVKHIELDIGYQNIGSKIQLNLLSADSERTIISVTALDDFIQEHTIAQIMMLGRQIGAWAGLKSTIPNEGLNINHIHSSKINKHTKFYILSDYEDCAMSIIDKYNTMFGTDFKVIAYTIDEYSYFDVIVSKFSYEDFFYLGYALGWAYVFEDKLT